MSKLILKYREVGIARFQNFFTGLKSKKMKSCFQKLLERSLEEGILSCLNG